MSTARSTAPRLELDIDMTFSVDNGGAAPGGSELTGTVTAAGTEVIVDLSSAGALGGVDRATVSAVREAGRVLAMQGITVVVRDAQGPIIRLGALPSGPVRRLFGDSRVMSVSLGRAIAALHGRRKGAEAPISMPPSTLWPLIPGLTKGPRARPTTTHAEPGSGRPRLIFVLGSDVWDGQPPREFDLGEVTTIGSSPDADLQLEGLQPIHATIRRGRDDEYRLEAVGAGGGTVLEDAAGTRFGTGRILRTGARIELGPWRMAYFREEFADHGRPYGGRVGGEFAVQRPQPPRKG